MGGIAIVHLDVPVPACPKRSGFKDTEYSGAIRGHQVHSATLRYALKRSTIIKFNRLEAP